MGKLYGASLKQVDQPPRGRHDYVTAITDPPDLLMNIAPAIHWHHLEVSSDSQTVDLGSNLDSQLTKNITTSRVGTTIKNFSLPPSLNSSSLRNLSMTGRENPMVFPDPVLSLAIRSFPL